MLLRTSRNAGPATAIALGLAVGTFPTVVQAPAAPADSPAAVPAPGNPTDSAEMLERSGKAEILEGSIKKVDPGAGTLQVITGPLGIMSRTLEVGADTQIEVDGRQGTLADLQEGTKVKAAYESRDGKDVATRIEVVPAQ
jgi:Cu/Ag efflux protein CusF